MKLFAAAASPEIFSSHNWPYAVGNDGVVYWFFTGPDHDDETARYRGESLHGPEWDVFAQLHPDGHALQAAVRKEFEAASPHDDKTRVFFSDEDEDSDGGHAFNSDSTSSEQDFEFDNDDDEIEYLDNRQMPTYYSSCPPAGGRDFKYGLWSIPEETPSSDSDSDTNSTDSEIIGCVHSGDDDDLCRLSGNPPL